MRDNGVSKVYATENAVAKHLAHHRMLVQFKTLRAVENFLVEVYAHPEFMAEYPVAAALPVRVRHRKGNKYAHLETDTNIMALHYSPRKKDAWALRMDTVLHELCHSVIRGEYEGSDTAHHGKEWRGVLVRLYSLFISPEASVALCSAFLQEGLL